MHRRSECTQLRISDETLALLWTMGSILRWMLDDLPLPGETIDPKWLRQRLELWLLSASDASLRPLRRGNRL